MDDLILGAPIGAVTLVADTVALLTEVLEGQFSVRQQTANWRRETMFSAGESYIDTAFTVLVICEDARKDGIRGGTLEETQRYLGECRRLQDRLTPSLTAFRLVASRTLFFRQKQYMTRRAI